MKKYPLGLWVVGVIVVLAVVNFISWRIYGRPQFQRIAIFSGGFLLGMLAMYIAVHLYRWK